MTETLAHKLRRAGLDEAGVSVRFDRGYYAARTKRCTYKGVHNVANFCPVMVSGSPEQLAFAWDVGIGNSTGIGFGSLI